MTHSTPAFSVGDRVRPVPGSVMCQQGEQEVIAAYSHPVTGDWLWLAREDGVVGSYVARFWEVVPAEAKPEVAALADEILKQETALAEGRAVAIDGEFYPAVTPAVPEITGDAWLKWAKQQIRVRPSSRRGDWT